MESSFVFFACKFNAMCNVVHVMNTQDTLPPVSAAPAAQTVTPRQSNGDDDPLSQDSLPQGNEFAKPIAIAELRPDVRQMLNSIMALAPRYSVLKSALSSYLSHQPLSQITREHLYSGAAILYWVRKLGLKRPRRGGQLLSQPTAEHLQTSS
jgi:hypothetical protein